MSTPNSLWEMVGERERMRLKKNGGAEGERGQVYGRKGVCRGLTVDWSCYLYGPTCLSAPLSLDGLVMFGGELSKLQDGSANPLIILMNLQLQYRRGRFLSFWFI